MTNLKEIARSIIGSRACSFKNEGDKFDFQTFGTENTEKKTKTRDVMLVPGALNDTKKIRKAGADIFANLRHDKP